MIKPEIRLCRISGGGICVASPRTPNIFRKGGIAVSRFGFKRSYIRLREGEYVSEKTNCISDNVDRYAVYA